MLTFLIHPLMLIIYGVIALALLIVKLAKHQKESAGLVDMQATLEKYKVTKITVQGEAEVFKRSGD